MTHTKLTKRVLLVEDHDDSRELFTFFLRRDGLDVVACRSVEDAVPAVADCAPDLALLDVRLPGRSGDDFGRELAERCPDTRIVFLTGEHDVDRLKRLVPTSRVLRKPITGDTLRSVVASA